MHMVSGSRPTPQLCAENTTRPSPPGTPDAHRLRKSFADDDCPVGSRDGAFQEPPLVPFVPWEELQTGRVPPSRNNYGVPGIE